MAPAIRLASEGFVLDRGDAEMLAEAAEGFRKDATTAAIFSTTDSPGVRATVWFRPILAIRCA
jgi:gamma-glutamyltranspeptidase/glutathione hydrolase